MFEEEEKMANVKMYSNHLSLQLRRIFINISCDFLVVTDCYNRPGLAQGMTMKGRRDNECVLHLAVI